MAEKSSPREHVREPRETRDDEIEKAVRAKKLAPGAHVIDGKRVVVTGSGAVLRD
ncbi:MAG: hypothetical protein HYS26_04150 [Candidatus Kaiserbacteria bacterium]|nr:MAG: hypothetical protein HYS26_04150 [Candidatus Kaiserbacteria bacterium]